MIFAVRAALPAPKLIGRLWRYGLPAVSDELDNADPVVMRGRHAAHSSTSSE